jgi:hypothetical protein
LVGHRERPPVHFRPYSLCSPQTIRIIVKDLGSARHGVDQDISPIVAQNSGAHTTPLAPHHRSIVAAAEKHADFFRKIRLKASAEVRLTRSPLPKRQL